MNLAGLRRERVLATAAGAALALLVLDRFVLGPVLAVWQERSEALQVLSASMAVGEAVVDQEARWLRWRADMDARLLPGTRSEAESLLLTQVDAWARAAGLQVTALRPRWRETPDGCPLLELQVGGHGHMESVMQFLYSLETAPLAVAVDLVELAATQNGGDVLGLNVRFTGLCRETLAKGKGSS